MCPVGGLLLDAMRRAEQPVVEVGDGGEWAARTWRERGEEDALTVEPADEGGCWVWRFWF